MPGYFYHGTTVENYKAIMRDGFIKPQSGNTYKNKIFLANNDLYARRVAFIKHATVQGENIVVFKIPKFCLKKKYLSDGSRHTAMSWHSRDKTWSYGLPIEITNDILVGMAPYTLNLPEGASIVREGHSTAIVMDEDDALAFLEQRVSKDNWNEFQAMMEQDSAKAKKFLRNVLELQLQDA